MSNTITIDKDGFFYLNEEKIIARLINKNVLFINKKPEQIFKKFDGVAINKELLEWGKDVFNVIYLKCGVKQYYTTRKIWLENGINWDNRGEAQLVLPFKEFDKNLTALKDRIATQKVKELKLIL